jgi:hypothetical protein
MKYTIYIICFTVLANVSALQAQKRPITLDLYSNVDLKGKDTLVYRWQDEGRRPFMVLNEGMYDSPTNAVGFLDTNGRVVVKASFSNCSNFVNGYAVVRSGGEQPKYGLIDRSGKFIFPTDYDAISKCLNGLFCLRKNGFIGFSDIKGKMIVPFGRYTKVATTPPVYREADDTPYEGFRWALLANVGTVQFDKYHGVQFGDKWAVINSKGKEVIPPEFDGFGIFKDDLAWVKLGKKVGVININSKMLVPANYDKIALAGQNFAYVTIGDKTGVLSISDNKLIIPMEYANIRKYTVGFIANKDIDIGTLYDEDGNRISKSIYYSRSSFPAWGNEVDGYFVYNAGVKKFFPYQDIVDLRNQRNGKKLLFFKNNNKWGFMDTTGREKSPPLFDYIDNRRDIYYNENDHDLFIAALNKKQGIVNTNGQILLPLGQDGLDVQPNGVIFNRGKKFGFWGNKSFKASLAKYDSVVVTQEQQHNNYVFHISARINNKWGLLDEKGKELTPFVYDNFLWFDHKLAIVKTDNKYGILNARGKQIIPCIYDEITFAAYNIAQLIVKKGIYFGVLDSLGKEVAPVIYNRIVMLNYPFSGKYRVMYKGNIGLLDGASKKIVIPCEYDDIKFYRNETNYGDSYYNYRGDDLPPLMASKNGKWGLIDLTGKERLPFNFYKIYIGENSNYIVTTYDGKEGLFGKNLKEVIPPNYNDILLIRPGIYKVKSFNNYGLINANGLVIAEAIYKSIDFCGDNFILKKGDKYGAIDLKGQSILPLKYTRIDCNNGKLVPVE